MRKTKIICTIGPASSDVEMLKTLMRNGMNVARLNFSHGTHDSHRDTIENIKKARDEEDAYVAILLDTKGPEIRTGKFNDEVVVLEEGQTFTLHCDPEFIGDKNGCGVTYVDLEKDVKPGDQILVDDGLISLRVQSTAEDLIECIVENGGEIKNNKGINVPNVKINLPSLTEKDKADLLFGIENGVDFVAASFIRTANDVHAIRKLLVENGGQDIYIISKIENKEGIDNIDAIIEASDGIMVARGDLGVEIPEEDVPIEQKRMIAKCNREGKIVVTATQMLDSMIRNPRPTRAEVTDVTNAILDGTDAIMLSGETASGKYPVEAVQMMNRIALKAETQIDYARLRRHMVEVTKGNDITDTIGQCTVIASDDTHAKAILTPTTTGNTAFMVAKFRPKTTIVAPTYKSRVARRLSLCWGTYPVMVSRAAEQRDIFMEAINETVNQGYAEYGDTIIITAGVPLLVQGNTNMMRIHIVGDEL